MAVRDWLVAHCLAVWPGSQVAVDRPDGGLLLPSVRIVTKELEFESETVLVDRLEATFLIRARRAVATGIPSEALLADAQALRLQLLSSVNPAGVAQNPHVKSVQLGQRSPADGEFEVEVEFFCEICAEREV